MPNTNTQPMIIAEKKWLTEDTLLIKLQPSTHFDYHSGQYVLLGMTLETLKPFSIARAPTTSGRIELHIRDHDQSQWMQDLFSLDVGETLYVQGPNDQYRLDAATELNAKDRVILVAGGTGFAPMFALLENLLKLDTRHFNRPIEFYWGAQTEAGLYRQTEMRSLAEKDDRLHFHTVISGDVSTADPQKLVHHQVLHDFPDLSRSRVYLCGSWAMQEAAKADFISAGLPEAAFN